MKNQNKYAVGYELHGAVHNGDINAVKDLLDSGADIKSNDKHGLSLLAYAQSDEDIEMLKYLINRGADIDYLDNEGKTVLMYAIAGGRISVVKCLVEAGADIDIVGRHHRTAEMMALRYGQENDNYEILEFLDRFNNRKANTLNENKYFNSGLYEEDTFYKHHEFSNETLHDDETLISYNREQLSKAWNLEDLEEVDERVWEGLDYENPYEPKVFNEEIAIECGLIPFSYDRSNGYLSLLVGWQGTDSRPRLDAYQLFTEGTIDKKSLFFLNRKYFERESSKEIIARMDEVLNIK